MAPRIAAYLALLAGVALVLPAVDRPSHGSALARMTGAALTALGVRASTAGRVVAGESFSMRVTPTCDGLDLLVILGLAILVTPTSWSRRLGGVAIAAVGTQLFNAARLVVMFLIGSRWPQYFELTHQMLFRPVAILAAVFLYGMWAAWALGASRRPA